MVNRRLASMQSVRSVISPRAILFLLRRGKLRLSSEYRDAVPALPHVAGAPKHTIVIGAGLAGLVTAYLLKHAGQRVTVLEAAERAGGRVRTLREPFFDGHYADVGAARIADTHYRTMWWIRHFQLPLEPMYPSAGHVIGKHKGIRVDANAACLSSHDLHHLMTGYTPWDRSSSEPHGMRTLVMHTLQQPSWYRIRGGMDMLPLAFSATLSGSIRYGSRVTALSIRRGGVEVTYQEGTTECHLAGDYVISAVPLTTLRSILIHPVLPDDKRRILNECQYGSAVRMCFQLRDQSWLGPGWNGYGRTEDGLEIWHPTFNGSSRRSMLIVYGLGTAARPFLPLSPGERLAAAMQRLEHFFPGTEALCEASAQVCWDEETWSLGTHPVSPIPWQVMARPEGRLHFAGAHASASGWMDGALTSGHRVAAEILRRAAEDDVTLSLQSVA